MRCTRLSGYRAPGLGGHGRPEAARRTGRGRLAWQREGAILSRHPARRATCRGGDEEGATAVTCDVTGVTSARIDRHRSAEYQGASFTECAHEADGRAVPSVVPGLARSVWWNEVRARARCGARLGARGGARDSC